MKKKTLPSVSTIPPDILEIFGPPPILSSEDERIYYAMLERFAKDIAPSDIIAWLLIKDLVDYRLEIARYRRMKLAIVSEGQESRMKSKIGLEYTRQQIAAEERNERKEAELRTAESIRPYDENKIREQKAEIELRFQKEASLSRTMFEHACQRLAMRGEDDFAIAVSYWIDDHDKIDQILDSAERKFLGTLREIDRHIFGFSKALREDLKTIEGEVLGSRQVSAAGRRETDPLKISRADPLRLTGSVEPVRNRGLEHDVGRSPSSESAKRAKKHRSTDAARQAELMPECVSPRA